MSSYLPSLIQLSLSKLPREHRFLDLSDYGRKPARAIATSLQHTSFTPIHVTIGFIISGLLAIFCLLNDQMWGAAFFLTLKSVLDAADGELARIKQTPSYTGRYFDSVSDIVLNLLIIIALWHVTNSGWSLAILAFIALQLQGTLYNYYYVILRNRFSGDTTSRVFEDQAPVAMKGESQRVVNVFFTLYTICYRQFDKAIFLMDRNAANGTWFPNWFMTAVSAFGLGFQLLIMSVMLLLGWIEYIIPFFICYSTFIFVLIGIRRFHPRFSAPQQH